MKIKKIKEELDEIETQNCAASEFCPADPTYFPSQEKKKRKRKEKERDVMQLESTEKGVSRKPRSPKSKDKQVPSDNSKKSGSNSRKRTKYADLYDGVEAQFTVKERAERVLSRLDNDVPHFMKCMLPSNVAHGFWLHLPARFCNEYLPYEDTPIVLVDEWGNEYKTSYLLGRHGLSAGWRGFSISHRLLKGDILIFHLTEPCKLKVHIVRVNDLDVVSAALCLLNMDVFGRGTGGEDFTRKDKRRRKRTKYVDPFLLDTSAPLINVKEEKVSESIIEPAADQSPCTSDGFSSEVIEGSETTNQAQSKEICYPKTSFMHDHSREGVTCW